MLKCKTVITSVQSCVVLQCAGLMRDREVRDCRIVDGVLHELTDAVFLKKCLVILLPINFAESLALLSFVHSLLFGIMILVSYAIDVFTANTVLHAAKTFCNITPLTIGDILRHR